MSTFIYVLLLEGKRYYIGKTCNIAERLDAHDKGIAGEWTKKYKPERAERIIEFPKEGEFEELCQTYIMKYGKEFVRHDV